jgi:hypothetical protein
VRACDPRRPSGRVKLRQPHVCGVMLCLYYFLWQCIIHLCEGCASP